MIILGIETSCDETAASLLKVDGGKFKPSIKVLSSAISSQIKIHARYGGVVPEVAARNHVVNILPVLKEALGSISEKKIDAVAVTYGPGLITSLRVGVEAARILSYIWKKPLINVNHIEGHIYSNWLKPVGMNSRFKPLNYKQIEFPALVLIVSGGHTELVLMSDHGKYKIIGQTCDDAAGEAFDKVARILGLPYPGGPEISARAEKFPISNFKFPITLPRPMINSNNFDFSFAGLKTAVLYLVRDIGKLNESKKITIAHEFQSAVTEVLVTKTTRAAKKYNAKTVMLSGGVSANKTLRGALEKSINALPGVQYLQPNLEYTTDNAAMIAMAGYFNYIKRPEAYKNSWKNIKIEPNLALCH